MRQEEDASEGEDDEGVQATYKLNHLECNLMQLPAVVKPGASDRVPSLAQLCTKTITHSSSIPLPGEEHVRVEPWRRDSMSAANVVVGGRQDGDEREPTPPPSPPKSPTPPVPTPQPPPPTPPLRHTSFTSSLFFSTCLAEDYHAIPYEMVSTAITLWGGRGRIQHGIQGANSGGANSEGEFRFGGRIRALLPIAPGSHLC